ncbi:MAG: ROK family protein [Clostridia bacterium]|nr:ROK family protein [Clostridia bacterium]MBQ2255708.1 ROK family protein [Clostridia bacterium]
MEVYLGIDIGGTKCALVLGDAEGRVSDKVRFETADRDSTLARIMKEAKGLIELAKAQGDAVKAIGVSCGGPLDSRLGLIQSPPNLPDWDNVPILQMLQEAFGLPCALCNDANACALAEYRFGAGKGCESMVFLTFGTGMGAGLVLSGKLYVGANDNAGEVGHVRLAPDGPVGYYKKGSFEGFCSGGGLAQLGAAYAKDALARGIPCSFCQSEDELNGITAKALAKAADEGDEVALAVWEKCGEMLGHGLAVLIDIINPERIVIGSIYARSGHLLRRSLEKVLAEEALPASLAACEIVPAALTESVGDMAALCVAMTAK